MALAILAGLAFFMICIVILAMYENRKYEIMERLNRQLIQPVEIKQSTFTFLGRFYRKLEAKLNEAGIKKSVDDIIMYYLYFLITCIAAGILLKMVVFFAGFIILSTVAFIFALECIKNNNRHRMEIAFGEFASDVTVLLRSNPNLIGAIQFLRNNIKNSLLSKEIAQICEEVEKGLSVKDAIINFRDRCSYSKIIESWADSIIFAYNTGASLVEVCEITTDKVNQKILRLQKIRQKTTQIKTAIIASLGVIICTLFVFIKGSPEFSQMYKTGMGQVLLLVAIIVMSMTTYLLLNKIDKMCRV